MDEEKIKEREKKEGETFALEMDNIENNWLAAIITFKTFTWNKYFWFQRKNDPYSLASLVSFEVKKMPYKDQPAKLPEGSIAVSIKI